MKISEPVKFDFTNPVALKRREPKREELIAALRLNVNEGIEVTDVDGDITRLIGKDREWTRRHTDRRFHFKKNIRGTGFWIIRRT